MKPDWATAPEWANFLTMDNDGGFCWWEYRPRQGAHNWLWNSGQFQPVAPPYDSMFIERRPATITLGSGQTIRVDVP